MKKGVVLILFSFLFLVGCATYSNNCQGFNCYGGHPLLKVGVDNQVCDGYYVHPDTNICLAIPDAQGECPSLNPQDNNQEPYFPEGITTFNAYWLPEEPNLCVFACQTDEDCAGGDLQACVEFVDDQTVCSPRCEVDEDCLEGITACNKGVCMPEIELDSCGQGEWSLPPHGFKTGGVYKVVNQLVLPNGEGRCFTIPRDDVLIDCQDNSINGVSRDFGGIGFYVHNNNVEIKNCNFLSLDKAIVLDNAHNNKITRNVFWHNSWGLFIENSNDNIFFDNKLTDNFYGASFIASSRNQFTGNTACNNQFEDTNEIISLLVQGSVQFNSNNFGHGNYLDKKNIKGLNNNIESQECIALQQPPPVPEAEPVEEEIEEEIVYSRGDQCEQDDGSDGVYLWSYMLSEEQDIFNQQIEPERQACCSQGQCADRRGLCRTQGMWWEQGADVAEENINRYICENSNWYDCKDDQSHDLHVINGEEYICLNNQWESCVNNRQACAGEEVQDPVEEPEEEPEEELLVALLGDVDGNGQVEEADARLVFDHVIDIEQLDFARRRFADVNHCQVDRIGITNVDGILIQRFAQGIINEFPCELPDEEVVGEPAIK